MGQRASKGSERSPPTPSRGAGQPQESPVLNNVAAHAQYNNFKNTLRTVVSPRSRKYAACFTTTPKSYDPSHKAAPCESCQAAPPGCRMHEPVGLRVKLPRNDSLVRSMAQVCRGPLYKEVNYTPVNMSRKSSSSSSGGVAGDTPFRRHHSRVYYDSHRDVQMSPAWSPARQTIGPDGLYPNSPKGARGYSSVPHQPLYSNGYLAAGKTDFNCNTPYNGAGSSPQGYGVYNSASPQKGKLVVGLSPVTSVENQKQPPSQHTPQNATPYLPSGPHTSTPKRLFPPPSAASPQQRTSNVYCSLPHRSRYRSAARARDGANPSLTNGAANSDATGGRERRSSTLDRSIVRRKLPYMADVRLNDSSDTSIGRQREPLYAEINSPCTRDDSRQIAVPARAVLDGPVQEPYRNGQVSRPPPGRTKENYPLLSRGVHKEDVSKAFVSVSNVKSSAETLSARNCLVKKENGRPTHQEPDEWQKVITENSKKSRHVSSSSSQQSSTSSAGKESPTNEAPPVKQWLRDLRILTDAECLNALQGKVLSKDSGLLEALTVGGAQETIESLRDRLEMIMKDHRKAVKRLEMSDWLKFSTFAADLCTGVKDLLRDFVTTSPKATPSEKVIKAESQVTEACAKLMHIINRHQESNFDGEKKKLLTTLTLLKDSLQTLVQILISKALTTIVERLDEGTSSFCVKRAIFALILLGQSGEPLCQLIAKADGVRALLAACIENKWRHLQASALRALTVICCVPEAVIQLEQAGGIECLTDILCDNKVDEPVRSEAAGLLAQITAPWMDSSTTALRGLGENISKLVKSLTELVRNTKCSEVMLLATAALANLSFLDVGACDWMRKHETIKVMVETCQQRVAESFFIKDQVATLLANMAASGSCRPEVTSKGGLLLLLCLLKVQPSAARNKAEKAACERVQQKAAIAISRLCGDGAIANTVAEMKGTDRLVQLCKDESERNNSDSVLVACLAAIRKIAKARGLDEFKKLDACELVEPKLWDSFLLYSSKQESYV